MGMLKTLYNNLKAVQTMSYNKETQRVFLCRNEMQIVPNIKIWLRIKRDFVNVCITTLHCNNHGAKRVPLTMCKNANCYDYDDN